MAPKTVSTASASRTGSNVADSLDADRIAEGILPSLRPRLRRVTVLPEVDSTNLELGRMAPGERHAHAVLAERQTRGRGRRQRNWHSPAGGNVYFSLGWRFPQGDHPLSTLPLIVAVATANALNRAGLEGHGIKWPNDVLVSGRKLAGILVELKSAGNGNSTAIIGIGINVRMPNTQAEDPEKLIDRPWTELEAHLGKEHKPCDRNALASQLLDQLLASLDRFERSGFETFTGAWEEYDLLQDEQVTLELDDATVNGVARGVNEWGELLLQTANGEVHSFHAGEVRVYRGIRAF